MRLAELEWGEVLDALPRWEALSPGARMAFVAIKPGNGADAAALGPAADELVAARFVTQPGPHGRLYPHAPELRPRDDALEIVLTGQFEQLRAALVDWRLSRARSVSPARWLRNTWRD